MSPMGFGSRRVVWLHNPTHFLSRKNISPSIPVELDTISQGDDGRTQEGLGNRNYSKLQNPT